MLRRTPTLTAALAAVLCAAMAYGGPARADARADATSIVELTVTQELFEAVMVAQGPLISSAIQNDLRARGITLSDPQRFTAILIEEMLAAFTTQMQQEFIPVYVDAFTPEELAGILAFYRSAPGQAMVAATPRLTQEGATIGSRVGAEIGAALQPRIAARLEAEGVQLTSDPTMMQRLIDSLR